MNNNGARIGLPCSRIWKQSPRMLTIISLMLCFIILQIQCMETMKLCCNYNYCLITTYCSYFYTIPSSNIMQEYLNCGLRIETCVSSISYNLNFLEQN